MRRARLAAILIAVPLLLMAACGSDDSSAEPDTDTTASTAAESTATDESSSTTAAVDPGSQSTFTSADLCELVPASDVAEALGVDVIAAEPFGGDTPQCSYSFSTPDGVDTNVVLAVPRPLEDLGGLVGEQGYELAKQMLAGAGVEVEEVPSVGSGATWISGASNSVMLAWGGDHVVTVAGTALTQEQGAALAARLLSAIT